MTARSSAPSWSSPSRTSAAGSPPSSTASSARASRSRSISISSKTRRPRPARGPSSRKRSGSTSGASLESSDAGTLLFSWRGCLFRVPDQVQAPKAGSLFFCRHLVVHPGERMLEIGGGLGLAAVLAARTGARVTAIDVLPAAVEGIRANAALNNVTIDARLGDCYAPVAGERFDLICANPPQMPTPPGRERRDPAAAADNGGADRRGRLHRGLAGAAREIQPGRPAHFTSFPLHRPR